MKLITQFFKTDCVIACLSMLSGYPYKHLLATFSNAMKYVKHSGAAISAMQKAIADMELRMQIYGYEMLAIRGAAETATGRSLQTNENNSQIAAIAQSLQDALKKAFWFLGKFN